MKCKTSLIFVILLSITCLVSFISSSHSSKTYNSSVDSSYSNNVLSTSSWHDDCSSTLGWVSHNESSDFIPKYPLLEGGTIQSSSGYLFATGIDNPSSGRQGPLWVKELPTIIPIESILLLEVEMEWISQSNRYGFMSVQLFDENREKVVILQLQDAWDVNHVSPEIAHFTSGETGNGSVVNDDVFTSWRGHLRFWYNSSSQSLHGEIDNGTILTQSIGTENHFDSDRSIRYIGIQFSRESDTTFCDADLRLHDITLTFEDDTISPTVDQSSDSEYEAGTVGHAITWIASDLNPDSYEILRNDELVESGTWSSVVTCSVDGLRPGFYNYTIILIDESGNEQSSSVFVTVVDTTSPLIVSPNDIVYFEDDTSPSISWRGSDLYPSSFEIRQNNSLVLSGDWNSTNEQITIDLVGLEPGTYYFEVSLIDEDNNAATDLVIVKVLSSSNQDLFLSLIISVIISIIAILSVVSYWVKFKSATAGVDVVEPPPISEPRTVSVDLEHALIEESESISERVQNESERRLAELDGVSEIDDDKLDVDS